jgi:hypothetical protein
MYRECLHGKLHPDFDHLAYMEWCAALDVDVDEQAMHICDGCCRRIFL